MIGELSRKVDIPDSLLLMGPPLDLGSRLSRNFHPIRPQRARGITTYVPAHRFELEEISGYVLLLVTCLSGLLVGRTSVNG